MKYDFDEIVPRRGTNAIKWDMDTDPEVLPMWVADMDFRTAPAVAAALKRRVQHDIFGYATAPKAYYDAITGWFRRRHGWQIRPEWVLHTTGVIPALSAVIKALTQPGDKVLIQTPVYNHFFTSIHNSGCQAAESPLVYRDNTYTIDLDDLERKAADPAVKLMLLCNPHNPAGRVWTPAELRRIGELCLRHDVVVVADEIHCELVMPGFSYTPFASLCEEFERSSVTCTSPSKAFNLAGLQVANIFAADAALRARIGHSLQINETGEIGPLAIEALIAAYDEGAEWLDALNEYLQLPLLAGVFRPQPAAVPGAAAGGDISGVGRLPGIGAYIRRAGDEAARRGETAHKPRVDIRRGRPGFHPPEHRLPAEIAGRGARQVAKGAETIV